ncbi:MAG: isopeptide-forming domain-containing fimbrial protein [Anaerococcus sp.]|uniref:isopeptide-forming domain-containing fimbrial protein n=1 Tax=Anaerococcus sp. TaxID=1872515 RepID=UPI0029100A5A|nr:isopeptide-forming domain-containing fimbrial protein [Anaerococcus sp.]MDU4026399.1 isopeptide-forming domain-containing fimbrial protein [Anaerococcus sp.]
MKKGKFLSSLAALAISASMLLAPAANAFAAEPDVNPGETPAVEDNNETGDETSATTDEKTSEVATINIHKIVMDAAELRKWIPEEHTNNGEKITNLSDWFGKNSKAKEVAGVHFEIYKEVSAETEGAVDGKTLKENNNNSDKIDAGKYYKLVEEKDTKSDGTGEIDLSKHLDKDEEGKVKETQFLIVENLDKSNYEEKDEKGNPKTLSKEGKAIPALITLPAVVKGDVLNLYPKNTDADKPEVVKDYKDQYNEEKANDKLNNKRDDEARQKDVKDHQIGDKLDYRVETLFKENTSYKTAYWEDNMTEGLTFNKDSLKVYIDGKEAAAEDYKVEYSNDRGFYLSLTDKGLEKVNGADKHLAALEYSATLNEKAIVNIPESNDVDFFYGNDKKQGNTPKSTKPVDKKITVEKSWDDGKFAKGEEATFQLYDESTGEEVGEPIKVDKENPTHTWENLNNEKSYKAVEINRKNGEEASYEVTDQGTIKVVNHKGNNKEINPKEPKVVQHGKKFVKVDDKTNKRLAGAEFVVINSDKKYLAQKSAEQTANNRQEYTEAKAIYDQYIADKKQAEADKQYEKVKAAYKELNATYEWVDDENSAIKLVSNEKGQFAIEGLADGTYYLKETKNPDGYAKIKEEKKFEVSADSWASEGDIEFAKDKEGEENIAADGESAMKIGNKKLTIPQTGGIGSLIFVVAGLALMAVAFVAMKRRNSYEA